MRPTGEHERRDRAIDECMGDLALVRDALARAVGDALKAHKRAGNPIAEWRDGRIRWLQPAEIPEVTG